MATINTQLVEPEIGWQRIDDTNEKLIYSNYNAPGTGSSTYYNNTCRSSTNSGNKLEFYFYGSKLRIIGDYRNAHRSNNIKITIDNVTETFSQLGGTGWIYKILNYEKQGLSLGKHHVTIQADGLHSSRAFILDAIDIDEGGVMLLQDEEAIDFSTFNNKESKKLNILSYTEGYGANVNTLFNGTKPLTVEIWTQCAFSFAKNGTIEFSTDYKCNIYRLGSVLYPNQTAQIPLYQEVNGNWIDITSKHCMSLTSDYDTWQLFIKELPAGHYKISGTGQRFDSEWFVEEIVTTPILKESQRIKTTVKEAILSHELIREHITRQEE